MTRFVPVLLVSLLALGVTSAAVDPSRVPCLDPRGCPDLVTLEETMQPFVQSTSFGPNHCAVVEGMTQAGARTLLRFTFTTPNSGAGDLIVGSPEAHPEWFEWSPCHGHYHFREYAAYRLWDPAAFAQWDALRAANPGVPAQDVLDANPDVAGGFVEGRKQGFCVIDIYRVTPGTLNIGKWRSCDVQGISTGWADEYYWGLDGQWVDVTGVPRGEYVLEAEVNYHQLYVESDYDNNRAFVRVTL